jgi:uncharacterized protein with FMN-binding domain
MVTPAQTRLAFRRNAAVAGATGVAAGFLFMYPTSTNSADKPAALARLDEPDGAEAGHALDDGHGHAANDVIRDADPFDGPAVDTPYGPVQVRIYVTEGRLVWVEALDYPRNSAVDRTLNEDAIPRLLGWVLLEEGAEIDTVSGATHTSQAYKKSLQAALDDADL